MTLVVLGALLVILGGCLVDVPAELRQPVAAAAGTAIAGILVAEARRDRRGDP